jgi:hypothetical protein
VKRLLLSLLVVAMLACSSPPKVPGKWQLSTSAESGFDVSADGTFQGELGAAGSPRIRLNGRWEAKGAEVTFTPEPGPAQLVVGTLSGKVDGDTMTLTSSGAGGAATFTFKRRPE